MTSARSRSNLWRRTAPAVVALASVTALVGAPQRGANAAPQAGTRSPAAAGEHRSWRDYGGGPDS